MISSILLGLLSLLLLFVLIAIIYLLWQINSTKSKDKAGINDLKQDIQGLTQHLTQSQGQIQERIDRTQSSTSESVQKQLSESAKLIADVNMRLTKLDETNKRVVDVADELKMLQNVLSNPKQRGGVGEYYLDTVLGNVLPPNGYAMQYKFTDGEIVDAIIRLDKDRILPIDSKFTLENYNRFVEEKDKAQKETLARKFKEDLKRRIDETSKYIRPNEGTLDYAFMFIPSEAIYYDLLINKVGVTNTSSRDLIEYAFRDKHVIIVSPTTLLAYLQTVLYGLRSLDIEDQAKDIQKRVGELGRHIGSYDEYMHKLGNSLGTTVNHYNTAHKELKKIDKDVVKIANSEPSVEPLLVDRPQIDD